MFLLKSKCTEGRQMPGELDWTSINKVLEAFPSFPKRLLIKKVSQMLPGPLSPDQCKPQLGGYQAQL